MNILYLLKVVEGLLDIRDSNVYGEKSMKALVKVYAMWIVE